MRSLSILTAILVTMATLQPISQQITAAPVTRVSNSHKNRNNSKHPHQPTSLAHFPYPISTLSPPPQPLYQPGEIVDSCKQHNSYAISFDDGPGQLTEELLDYLDEQGLKVTFFMNGDNWRCIYGTESQRLLKRAFLGQHQIAAHPWSHSDLEGLKDDEIRLEMQKIEDAFRQILGVVPRYMRPPYGEHSERVRKIMEEMGYVMVLWDVDQLDGSSSPASPSLPVISTVTKSQEQIEEELRWVEEDDSDELVMSADADDTQTQQIHMVPIGFKTMPSSPVQEEEEDPHRDHHHHEDKSMFSSSSSSSNKWAEAVRGVPHLALDRDAMVVSGIYQDATSVWAVEYVQSLGLDIMPVAQCLGETDPRLWYKEISKPADPASLPQSCYF